VWELEIRAIATLMLIWSIEDTVYFFVNPAFGFQKYDPEHVKWHKDWVSIAGIRIGDKGMMFLLVQGLALLILSFFLTGIWHLIVNVFQHLMR
jgi:hypothetical protein